MAQPTRKIVTAEYVKAASIALLLFVYTVLALSVLKVSYTETFHRITIKSVFDDSLFGSAQADGLAAISLSLLFVASAKKSRGVAAACISAFAAAAGLCATGSPVIIPAGLASLPLVLVPVAQSA